MTTCGTGPRSPRPPPTTLFAEAALAGAEALGPDTPAGARLADSGRFLKYLSEDLLRHVEYWHTAITGRGPAVSPPDQPSTDPMAHRTGYNRPNGPSGRSAPMAE